MKVMMKKILVLFLVLAMTLSNCMISYAAEDVVTVECTGTEDCAATEHHEGCLAAQKEDASEDEDVSDDEDISDDEDVSDDEDIQEDEESEDEEYLPCDTEGCELVKGHPGECTGASVYSDTEDDGTVTKITIGTTEYDTLASAISNASDRDIVLLPAGTYTLPSTISKKITLKGTEQKTVIIDMTSCSGNIVSISELSFENLTIEKSNKNYVGFYQSTSENFTNCIINGVWWAYATTANFTSCTFNQTSADGYNVWCYGSTTVNFTDCTFNCAGKSVLVYNEGSVTGATINVSGCTFKATQEADGKAAIEIDATLLKNDAYYTVNISDSSADGFSEGSNSGSTLWNNKTNSGNNTVSTMQVVTVDEEIVYKLPVTGLEGSGTAEDPYLITNIDELKWFRDDVNSGNTYNGKYVKLTTDIDLDNEEWTPIGYMGATFNGTFDGGENTISNLKISKKLTNTAANNGIGFFGKTLSPAVIKNLTIENVEITGSLYVGAVVGYGYTGSEISNVTVKGDIAIDAWWYAGVIGGNGYLKTVDNCQVIGNDGSYIKGNDGSYIGGIWGFRGEGNMSITNCSVENLEIIGVDRVGGISGMAHYQNTISNCTVKNTTITATDEDATTVGLIAGACQGTDSGQTTFTNNTVSDDVTATAGDNVVRRIYGTNIDGEEPVTNYVALVDGVLYETVKEALDAVEDGQKITILDREGSEVETELNFSKSGTFTITGYAPDYKMPIITVTNETGTTVLNIEDATLAMAEIDARKNATINVIDSTIKGANGDGIVKAYYNGVINVSGDSEIETMQVTVMGRLNLSDSAKITATWQTNVLGNGIITINDDAILDTAGLNVTGAAYEGRDNTDADRVGKPATILVDGGTLKTLDYDHAYYYEADDAVIGTATTNGLIEVINGGTTQLNQSNGVTVNAGGTIKVDDSTLIAKSEEGTSVVTVNGTLEMKDAEFEGSILVTDDAAANITDSVITNTDEEHSAIETTGTLTLTDVDITSARHAVRVEGGETTIDGGTYQVSGTADMTTHAINAGGGSAEAKVTILGGTFIGPKGTAGDSGSAVTVQENATVVIKDGAFSGGLNDLFNAKNEESLTISGGYFDQYIEQYLADGMVCVKGTYAYDGVLYSYSLAAEDELKSEVDIEIKDTTDASISGNFTTEEAAKALEIAESVTVEEAVLVASVQSVRAELRANEETETTAKEALENAGIDVEGVTVTTLVKPYLKVVLKALDETAVDQNDTTIIGFEMEMLYDVIATTNPADQTEDNTVVISTGNVVEEPEAATISFKVLAELIDEAADLTEKDRVLYVEHIKADTSVYNHDADLDEGTEKDVVSFYNDRGYSTFNLKIAENEVPEDKPFQPTGSGSGSSSSSSSSSSSKEPTEVYYVSSQAAQTTTAPSTGDTSNAALWISVMGIALVAVVAAVTLKKRGTK